MDYGNRFYSELSFNHQQFASSLRTKDLAQGTSLDGSIITQLRSARFLVMEGAGAMKIDLRQKRNVWIFVQNIWVSTLMFCVSTIHPYTNLSQISLSQIPSLCLRYHLSVSGIISLSQISSLCLRSHLSVICGLFFIVIFVYIVFFFLISIS